MAAKTNGTSFPIWICSNGYALGIHAWGVFSHISFGIVLTGYSGCLSIDYRNRKYRESDKQLAIYLAEMIQLALRRYSSVSGSDQSRLRQALMDIVDGVQVTLNQRRTIDTSYLEQEHICVKIKFRSPLVQLPVKYLCNAIEDEFRRSVAFEYDESLICFIEISRQQAEEESYLTLLQKHLTPLLRAFDSSVGISDPFHDIYHARPYYYQACAAVENGQLGIRFKAGGVLRNNVAGSLTLS